MVDRMDEVSEAIGLRVIGPNFARVDLIGGALTVWFSYNTPIAFQELGEAPVVRENEWGPTTGKHMNCVDPKARRVSAGAFADLLDAAIAEAV